MVEIAAGLYVAIIGVVILFQFALVAGMPWGPLTQGGKHPGALPVSARVAALVSVLLLAAMAAGVTSAAGMLPNWPTWTGWLTLGVQSLSTLMNWITPSKRERQLWGPVTTAMLGLAGYVVLAGVL